MKNPFEQPQSMPVVPKKRETAINRVLADNSHKEDDVLQALKRTFEAQQFYGAERDKTDNESQIITYLIENMPQFVERYGGTAINVTQENVHVLDPKLFTSSDWKWLKGRNVRAYYATQMQGIAMLMSRQEDDVEFANISTHELMHLHSFQSLQIQNNADTDEQYEMIERRSGMQILGKDEHEDHMMLFLNWLNEAITEELTRRFIQEHHAHIPGIDERMKKRREYFPHMSDSELISSTHIYKWKEHGGKVHDKRGDHHTYKEFRGELNGMIDTIYEKKNDQFASREDVFAVFARAYFTGRLLPVARLIDDVYGKGSFVAMARHDGMQVKTSDHTVSIDKNVIK